MLTEKIPPPGFRGVFLHRGHRPPPCSKYLYFHFKLQTSYKQCEARTKQSYETSLKNVEASGSYCGIKFKCPIESLYFHPMQNYSADIHHDIFEGVAPHLLKLTLLVNYGLL